MTAISFFYRLRIKDPKAFIDVVKKILSKTFKVVVQQITLAHEFFSFSQTSIRHFTYFLFYK